MLNAACGYYHYTNLVVSSHKTRPIERDGDRTDRDIARWRLMAMSDRRIRNICYSPNQACRHSLLDPIV